MVLDQEYKVFDWFRIHFIENPGMAFGLEFGGSYGKLFLTLFRVIAVVVIGFIIRQLTQKKVAFGILFGMAMIMAGAIGNIIDSIFYGVLFSTSPRDYQTIAEFLPLTSPLSSLDWSQLFYGKVVDMLYFPLVKTYWPDWVPYFSGSRLEFFRPVFNIADSAISIGIFYLLLFHRSFFTQGDEDQKEDESIKLEKETEPIVILPINDATSNTELLSDIEEE